MTVYYTEERKEVGENERDDKQKAKKDRRKLSK